MSIDSSAASDVVKAVNDAAAATSKTEDKEVNVNTPDKRKLDDVDSSYAESSYFSVNTEDDDSSSDSDDAKSPAKLTPAAKKTRTSVAENSPATATAPAPASTDTNNAAETTAAGDSSTSAPLNPSEKSEPKTADAGASAAGASIASTDASESTKTNSTSSNDFGWGDFKSGGSSGDFWANSNVDNFSVANFSFSGATGASFFDATPTAPRSATFFDSPAAKSTPVSTDPKPTEGGTATPSEQSDANAASKPSPTGNDKDGNGDGSDPSAKAASEEKNVNHALGPWDECTGEENEDTMSKHFARVWKAVPYQPTPAATTAASPAAASTKPGSLVFDAPAKTEASQHEAASPSNSKTLPDSSPANSTTSDGAVAPPAAEAKPAQTFEKASETGAAAEGVDNDASKSPATSQSTTQDAKPQTPDLCADTVQKPTAQKKPRYKYKDIGFGPLKVNVPKPGSATESTGWSGPRLIMRMGSSIGSTFGTKLLLNIPLLAHVQCKRLDAKKLSFMCCQRFTDAGAVVGVERFKFRFDTEQACSATLDAILKYRQSSAEAASS